jgi:hypothetical protein
LRPSCESMQEAGTMRLPKVLPVFWMLLSDRRQER